MCAATRATRAISGRAHPATVLCRRASPHLGVGGTRIVSRGHFLIFVALSSVHIESMTLFWDVRGRGNSTVTVFSLLFARRKNTKTKTLPGVKPTTLFSRDPRRVRTRAKRFASTRHYVGRSRSLSYPAQIHLFDRFALRIIPHLCLTRRASSRAQRAARAAQPRACLAGHARRPCPAS